MSSSSWRLYLPTIVWSVWKILWRIWLPNTGHRDRGMPTALRLQLSGVRTRKPALWRQETRGTVCKVLLPGGSISPLPFLIWTFTSHIITHSWLKFYLSDLNGCFSYFQDGNPFGPFWQYVGVEFDKSILFSGISFSAYNQPHWMKKWVNVWGPLLSFLFSINY